MLAHLKPRARFLGRIHRFRSARGLGCLVLLLLLGCRQGPPATATTQSPPVAQQSPIVAQQQLELRDRNAALDNDNQELEALLAQSRQKIQLQQDEIRAVRDQLRSSTSQLSELRRQNQNLESKSQAMMASMKRRSGATIKPNNGLLEGLTAVHIPGCEVRQDGGVIRIEMPRDRMFRSGTATLKPDGIAWVDSVAGDVLRRYAPQVIGIEGHTDATPIRTPQFPSNLHLSTAHAMTIYEHLLQRHSVSSQQLFVVGHGGNHPVVSNATPAGHK